MKDERQTLFSRIALMTGTPAHAEFYRDHPPYEAKDAPFHGVFFAQNLQAETTLKAQLHQRVEAHTDWIVKEHHRVAARAVNDTVTPITASELERVLFSLGAVDVQIVPLEPEDYYSHHGTVKAVLGLDLNGVPITPSYRTAVLFAFAMEDTPVHQAPFAESYLETMRVYTQVAHAAFVGTTWLKEHGTDASAQHREYYLCPLVPLAHKHHFGTIGMANHLVHPTYGNAIRLGAILTHAPLPPQTRPFFDVRRFCRRCALCLMNCPTQAIKAHPQPHSVFYRFDEHRCFTMFQNVGTDCSLCVSSCPFSSQALDATVLETLTEDRDIDAWLKHYLTTLGPKRRPTQRSTWKERGSVGINL